MTVTRPAKIPPERPLLVNRLNCGVEGRNRSLYLRRDILHQADRADRNAGCNQDVFNQVLTGLIVVKRLNQTHTVPPLLNSRSCLSAWLKERQHRHPSQELTPGTGLLLSQQTFLERACNFTRRRRLPPALAPRHLRMLDHAWRSALNASPRQLHLQFRRLLPDCCSKLSAAQRRR